MVFVNNYYQQIDLPVAICFMQKIVLQDKVDQIGSFGDCQPNDSISATIIHPYLAIPF
jgi:hypothetical protein